MREEPEDYVIAIVGAGPYGLSMLERISANLPEYLMHRKVQVHLIDPYLERGGRIWQHDQPDQLWMNSLAGSVSLFTDESVRCSGPIRRGPTLSQWATSNDRSLSADKALDGLLGASSPYRWASRSLMGEYMRWFLDFVTKHAPGNLRVHTHEKKVIDICPSRGVTESGDDVWLEGDSRPIKSHRVVLAQGNPASLLTDEQDRLAELLPTRGGSYTPPGQATLRTAAACGPGEPVLVRGMGLTFFDYVQLFTTARGGFFHQKANGELSYKPSGREPRLFVSSGRGVPYRPIFWPISRSRLLKCSVPQYVSSETIRAFARDPRDCSATLDFQNKIISELKYAYYAELVSSDPDRCSVPWSEYSRLFLSTKPGSALQDELIAEKILKAEDRLDFESIGNPLKGVSFQHSSELQQWMRRYVARETNRMLSGSFSCDQALVTSLRRLYVEFAQVFNSGTVVENSAFFRSMQGWMRSNLQFLNGGAPWPRQRELIALSRSGVVTFLGAGAKLKQSEEGGFICSSTTLSRASVEITHVIDARNSQPSVSRSCDSLRRRLCERGEISALAGRSNLDSGDVVPRVEAIRVTNSGEMICADGSVSPTRFAVGVGTSYRIVTPGLPGAHANSDFLLMTDRVARKILESLSLKKVDHQGPLFGAFEGEESAK
ncbi:FAD/NAD(P)-binding protein [Streptomyces sp. NBC_00893]|nr:FAD/NAD(P)-binding protein [Streptomyces sp. NBC_00893]